MKSVVEGKGEEGRGVEESDEDREWEKRADRGGG